LSSIGLSNLFSSKVYSYVGSSELWQFSDPGVSERIHHIKIAFSWWLENPFMGIGLGSYLSRQIEQNMMPLSTIHQTPLWLLTETGLIGFILMLVFAYAALKNLHQSSLLSKNNTLAAGGFAMILTYALASLTSEIMYQRYLWFFLGMLLVQSNRKSPSEQKDTIIVESALVNHQFQ
jgi:O-antigen ligase